MQTITLFLKTRMTKRLPAATLFSLALLALSSFVFLKQPDGAPEQGRAAIGSPLSAGCFSPFIANRDSVSCNGGNDGACTFVVTHTSGTCTCPTVDSIRCQLRQGANTVASVWLIPGSSSNFTIDVNFINLPKGTYDLYVRANGNSNCEDVFPGVLVIDEPAAISAETFNVMGTPCPSSANGQFQVNAMGGTPPYTFSLAGGQTFNGVMSNQVITFMGLTAGTKTLNITDSKGCPLSKTVNISAQNQEIMAATSLKHATCFGFNDGAITFNSISGGGGSSYTVNGNPVTVLPNLTAGMYSVTITALPNGCTKVFSYNITEPAPINLTTGKTNVTCQGKNDGTATAVASGGSGGFSYSWSHIATGSQVINLSPGVYAVTATDSKGCTAVKGGIQITEPGALTFAAQSNSPVKSGSQAQITLLSPDTTIKRYEWEIIDQLNLSGNLIGQTGTTLTASITKNFTLADDRAGGRVVYEVIPVFNDDCKGTPQNVTIQIQPDVEIFIPEVFTPNEGSNDNWQVILPAAAENGKVLVFNRAGGKVFEGASGSEWRAENCPAGVYFYVVSYTLDNEKRVLKGAVTVLKGQD